MQRETRQRRAIQQVFDEATRPLGPEEVLVAARRWVPQLGQATVYRALGALQQERRVVPVDIPGHPSRYERAGLKHHHHFACTGCGRVFELDGCPYAGDKGVPRGFNVEGHEIILYGRCSGCSAAPRRYRGSGGGAGSVGTEHHAGPFPVSPECR